MSPFSRIIFRLDKVEVNFDLKAPRGKKVKDLKEKYVEELVEYSTQNNLSIQKISDEELEIIKENIRYKIKTARLRSYILTIASLFLIIVFVIILLKSI